MVYYLLGFVHILVCIVLVFFILIQNNKGMGMSGAFGSMGASDSVFGASSGFNILIKITIGVALVFTLSTIMMNVIQPSSDRSLMQDVESVGTGPSFSELAPAPPDAQPAEDGAAAN